MPWNDGLTGQALAIASSNDSPLRVVAGPGTGKTFALKRRVARFLEEGTDPDRILVVTFTRMAARDIEREIGSLNVPGATRVQKGTLHSFCFTILHRANVLGLIGRVPRPLLKFEERFMLEDLGHHGGEDFNARKRRLKAFEAVWAREQDQDPGWPQDEADRRFQVLLDEWLRFHQAMLVGELIPITLRYLRDNPACPELRQYDHLLVDEYQDLNRAEQHMIDLLGERGGLTLVGDEDQSIYEALRYAHPEGIAEFHETHPGTSDIPLHECRRCPTKIVAMANELIRYNIRRTGRVMTSLRGNPRGDIHVVQWDDMTSEAEGIADFITSKVNSNEFEPGKTLVLCPRRQFGYMIRDALRARHISAHSFFHEEDLDGNSKNPDESQAQEAFELLTLVANPDDRVALRCWLGFGHRILRKTEYERLREYCSNHGGIIRDVLNEMVNGNLSIPHTDGIVDRYRLLLQRLRTLSALTGRDIFDAIFPDGQEWAEAFRIMAEELVDDWTAANVLKVLRTNITQPELPSDVGYVRVMSLHKSKGLNADHVIVTGFIKGLIPSERLDLPFNEEVRYNEEQRRLFYVAITRAKRTLVLSSILNLPRDLAHAWGVIISGNDRTIARTIASTFLAELGPECPRPVASDDWNY